MKASDKKAILRILRWILAIMVYLNLVNLLWRILSNTNWDLGIFFSGEGSRFEAFILSTIYLIVIGGFPLFVTPFVMKFLDWAWKQIDRFFTGVADTAHRGEEKIAQQIKGLFRPRVYRKYRKNFRYVSAEILQKEFDTGGHSREKQLALEEEMVERGLLESSPLHEEMVSARQSRTKS